MTLEKLKKLIQTACPDLKGEYKRHTCGRIPCDNPVLEDCLEDWSSPKTPQLADVLRAYDKTYKNKPDSYGNYLTLEITSFGMFTGDCYDWENEPIFWKLDSDLDGQDEATILFLIELLE